jgi:hypothetical protein
MATARLIRIIGVSRFAPFAGRMADLGQPLLRSKSLIAILWTNIRPRPECIVRNAI